MIVENSGLLTVAALKHLNMKTKIVSILSGGNMDDHHVIRCTEWFDPETVSLRSPYCFRQTGRNFEGIIAGDR